MKIFSRRNITIYTLLVFIATMIIFEIGFCNVQVIHQGFNSQEIEYNFSPCRIIVYLIFIILYCIFKNKFLETAEETFKNKTKRIITYIVMAISAISCIYFLIFVKRSGMDFVRYGSVRIIISLLTTLFVIYVSKDISKNVIIAGCTFGIVFTFSTDYNHAIDEKKHFMSALNVSFLNFDYVENPITDTEIAKIPHLTKYVSIDEFLKNNYTPSITDEVDMEDTPSTPASYNLLVYVFPGLGIAIARLLNGSIIDMYILGRIMNLALYTLLVYIATKLLPFKKNIFFVVAFMPYMLLLASSYSADGVCLGTIYIFIAYCLKLYKENEKISLKQFVILAILFGIMLIGKGVGYLPIAILVFILPLIKTIKENKKYWPAMISCGIIFIILGTFFVIYMKNKNLSTEGDNRGEEGINSVEQLKEILTNPILDLKVASNHILDTLVNFNWLTALQPDVFFTSYSENTIFIMLFVIFYISLTEDDYNFKIKDKIILILSFLLPYGMTSAILYLSFTPVGDLHILGYQARYIFPILPLLLACISTDKIKCQKSEDRNMKIALASCLFLVIGLFQLTSIG